MNPISKSAISSLSTAKQYFSDCYLVASMNALSRSVRGRRIVRSNIFESSDSFRVRFKNIDNRREEFQFPNNEHDKFFIIARDHNIVIGENAPPHNPIIKMVETAMDALVAKYPHKKPPICHLTELCYRFEYNKPSNFLKMFTGKKPIVLNESSLHMSMKSCKKQALNLFKKISEDDGYSFVVGTGFKFRSKLSSFHCYALEKVDLKNKTITIYDGRDQKSITLTFKEAINNLKFIVGYFSYTL